MAESTLPAEAEFQAIFDLHPNLFQDALKDLQVPATDVTVSSTVKISTPKEAVEKSFDGRFSKMTPEEIDNMIDNSKNSNTVATTKKWIAVLDEYCQKRHTPIDLASVSAEKLSSILKHAYVEIRQKLNHKPYSKSSLISFRAAVQRKLSDFKRPINIITDSEFKSANQALRAFFKKQKSKGELKETQHKEAISTSDQDTLQEYFTKNHTTDPIALAEMNWFVITQHFCLRGREMQSELCIEDFLISTNSEFGEYVKLITKPRMIKAASAPLTRCQTDG